MKAYTSHLTALEYWRCHFPLDSELGSSALTSKIEACAVRKADVLECVPETYRIEGRPIDVLAFSAGARRPSAQVSCRSWTLNLPAGAFYRAGSMMVSSPEFLFLQMAGTLSTSQLVALGCELCGTYILLPPGVVHPGSLESCPRRIAPLTNRDRLGQFLVAAKDAKGAAKARRALPYVVEGSRSPMETMTYQLLCLPPLLGGYGIPKPQMNAIIPLDVEAQRVAHRGHAEGDLCWLDAKLDLEYKGSVHEGPAAMRDDAGRELGIGAMGWRVVSVTSSQVLDMGRFEVVAKEVARHLHYRLYSHVLGSTPTRLALRQELEAWTFGVG